MCLYIVDNVSTCRIIYFWYVSKEKRINNSPIWNLPEQSSYSTASPALISSHSCTDEAVYDPTYAETTRTC